MKTLSDASPCPCGGGRYADCCGRFHRGAALPDSAEQLMRSRYSAYALGNDDWLRRTWHASTRPPASEDILGSDSHGQGLNWLGLRIVSREQQDDDHATVDFVARFKQGGRAGKMHERSRFVREPDEAGGEPRWWYVDGALED